MHVIAASTGAAIGMSQNFWHQVLQYSTSYSVHKICQYLKGPLQTTPDQLEKEKIKVQVVHQQKSRLQHATLTQTASMKLAFAKLTG